MIDDPLLGNAGFLDTSRERATEFRYLPNTKIFYESGEVRPAAAHQRLPSGLLAEAFSFSDALSSDGTDLAFSSLFWPSAACVGFEVFEFLSPVESACPETFESFPASPSVLFGDLEC